MILDPFFPPVSHLSHSVADFHKKSLARGITSISPVIVDRLSVFFPVEANDLFKINNIDVESIHSYQGIYRLTTSTKKTEQNFESFLIYQNYVPGCQIRPNGRWVVSITFNPSQWLVSCDSDHRHNSVTMVQALERSVEEMKDYFRLHAGLQIDTAKLKMKHLVLHKERYFLSDTSHLRKRDFYIQQQAVSDFFNTFSLMLEQPHLTLESIQCSNQTEKATYEEELKGFRRGTIDWNIDLYHKYTSRRQGRAERYERLAPVGQLQSKARFKLPENQGLHGIIWTIKEHIDILNRM